MSQASPNEADPRALAAGVRLCRLGQLVAAAGVALVALQDVPATKAAGLLLFVAGKYVEALGLKRLKDRLRTPGEAPGTRDHVVTALSLAGPAAAIAALLTGRFGPGLAVMVLALGVAHAAAWHVVYGRRVVAISGRAGD